jgi:hypothetical protein
VERCQSFKVSWSISSLLILEFEYCKINVNFSIQVRFTNPVFPRDKINVQTWKRGSRIYFECFVEGSGLNVIQGECSTCVSYQWFMVTDSCLFNTLHYTKLLRILIPRRIPGFNRWMIPDFLSVSEWTTLHILCVNTKPKIRRGNKPTLNCIYISAVLASEIVTYLIIYYNYFIINLYFVPSTKYTI